MKQHIKLLRYFQAPSGDYIPIILKTDNNKVVINHTTTQPGFYHCDRYSNDEPDYKDQTWPTLIYTDSGKSIILQTIHPIMQAIIK